MFHVFLLSLLFIDIVRCDCHSPTYPPAYLKQYLNRTLTVYNQCGEDYDIYYGAFSLPLPDECKNGSYCSTLNQSNPAIWISKKGFPALNFGSRTIVEFNFLDENAIWWDISLVKGFNVGAKIAVFNLDGSSGSVHPETICTSANCLDAYWICDTAWDNLFHPVYRSYNAEGYVEITFCPENVTDTTPLHPYPPKRNITGEPPFYCACSEGIPSLAETVPSPKTILNGSLCGPIS